MLNNFKIAEKWKIWYSIPAFILLISLVVFFCIGGMAGNLSDGINIGIDFTGGTILTVTLGDEISDLDDYEANVKIISDIVKANGAEVSFYQRSSTDETASAAIDFRYKNPKEGNEMKVLNDTIAKAISVKYYGDDTHFDDTSFIGVSTIGKSAASSLLKKALLAVLISTALIMIYIIIRFELWSGITAVIALMHDVIIMLAVTVIFQIQINTSFIAAVITIIAYSINNTIVIFDRVREKTRSVDDRSKIDFNSVSDGAIRDTLTRTLFTSATTMITVVMLAILGVPSMREFTLPIIFGLLAGTYSSVFVATPTWSQINKKFESKKIKTRQTFKK